MASTSCGAASQRGADERLKIVEHVFAVPVALQ